MSKKKYLFLETKKLPSIIKLVRFNVKNITHVIKTYYLIVEEYKSYTKYIFLINLIESIQT